jgi:hypothetical protein
MSTTAYTLAESDVASYLRDRMRSPRPAGLLARMARMVRRLLGR